MIELVQIPLPIDAKTKKAKLGQFRKLAKYPNEYFYDKFDIFNEDNWVRFILEFHHEGQTLPKYDKEGTKVMYAITVKGADKNVRKFFENKRQTACYLYPLMRHVNKDNPIEPILSKNKQNIWAYLRDGRE